MLIMTPANAHGLSLLYFLHHAIDEIGDELLEPFERRQIHDHGNITADVALAYGEVYVQEEDETLFIGVAEQEPAIAAADIRKRCLQRMLQHVGHRAQATVEDNVAGLGQRLFLYIEDLGFQHLICRLLLEKKNQISQQQLQDYQHPEQ